MDDARNVVYLLITVIGMIFSFSLIPLGYFVRTEMSIAENGGEVRPILAWFRKAFGTSVSAVTIFMIVTGGALSFILFLKLVSITNSLMQLPK